MTTNYQVQNFQMVHLYLKSHTKNTNQKEIQPTSCILQHIARVGEIY